MPFVMSQRANGQSVAKQLKRVDKPDQFSHFHAGLLDKQPGNSNEAKNSIDLYNIVIARLLSTASHKKC